MQQLAKWATSSEETSTFTLQNESLRVVAACLVCLNDTDTAQFISKTKLIHQNHNKSTLNLIKRRTQCVCFRTTKLPRQEETQ